MGKAHYLLALHYMRPKPAVSLQSHVYLLTTCYRLTLSSPDHRLNRQSHGLLPPLPVTSVRSRLVPTVSKTTMHFLPRLWPRHQSPHSPVGVSPQHQKLVHQSQPVERVSRPRGGYDVSRRGNLTGRINQYTSCYWACHQKYPTLRFRPSPSGIVMMTRRNSSLDNSMYSSNIPLEYTQFD